MKTPAFQTQFQKDIKLCEKRGKDLTRIKAVMFDLIMENSLAQKYRDHNLSGNYSNCRECHIEPDWLLIYMYKDDGIVFVRTGSHSDLF